MKKVLFLVGEFNTGGLENVILNIIDNISKTFVISIGVVRRESNELNVLYDRNVVIHDLPNPRFHPIRYILRVRELSKKFDIVHSHNNYLSLYDSIANIGLIKPKRFIHSHNSRFLKVKFRISIIRIFLRLFKGVRIACSSEAAKALFGKKNSSLIIKNGIDVLKFKYNQKIRDDLRKKFNLENKIIVGSVGRIVHQKNFSKFIDIAKNLIKLNKNYYFIIIGEGDMKNKIIDQINVNKLHKNILFFDFLENINEMLMMFDIFLLPSNYEGLGIVFIESQSTGLHTFGSCKVPKEVKITDLYHSIELNNSSQFWAEYIDTYSNESVNREDYYLKVKNAEYGILEMVKAYEEVYLNNLDNEVINEK